MASTEQMFNAARGSYILKSDSSITSILQLTKNFGPNKSSKFSTRNMTNMDINGFYFKNIFLAGITFLMLELRPKSRITSMETSVTFWKSLLNFSSKKAQVS